jgi:hypothetical protein
LTGVAVDTKALMVHQDRSMAEAGSIKARSACERISKRAIIFVALALAVGAWACSRSLVISSEPSSRFTPVPVIGEMGEQFPRAPSPTPQPTPSQ